MTKLGILGATALSLSLAVASPALAQHVRGGAAVHANGGANFSGARSGSFNAAPQANLRGANASIVRPAATTAGPNVAAPSAAPSVATPRSGGERFVDRGFRGDRDRRFGAGAGFVAGLAAGSALGFGYGYDPYYYGDDYAYYDGGYYAARLSRSLFAHPAHF